MHHTKQALSHRSVNLHPEHGPGSVPARVDTVVELPSITSLGHAMGSTGELAKCLMVHMRLFQGHSLVPTQVGLPNDVALLHSCKHLIHGIDLYSRFSQCIIGAAHFMRLPHAALCF
jgi:hypothetical protein